MIAPVKQGILALALCFCVTSASWAASALADLETQAGTDAVAAAAKSSKAFAPAHEAAASADRAGDCAGSANRDEVEKYSDFRPYAGGYPNRIELLRDGGTIILPGDLNRSVSAKIRLDRRTGSPTYGRFFVIEDEAFLAVLPERAMTRSELEGLSVAIGRFLREDPKEPQANIYEQLLKGIEVAAQCR